MSLNSSATTATISNLDASTDYDFRLVAKNSSGNSDWSTINNIKTYDPPLTKPENFHSSLTAQTTLSLDWNNVVGATSYILERKNSSGIFEKIYEGADSKFIDTKLTADTQYEYRVKATTDNNGESNFTTLTTQTSAKLDENGKSIVDIPVFLSSKINSDGSVTLTWTDLGSDYSYILYKAGRVVVNGGLDNSYTDTSPANNGIEGYILRSYYRPTGKTSAVTTTVVYSSSVKSVEITGYETSSDGQITLLWDAEAGVTYYIFRAGKNISGQILGDSSSNGIASWTDSEPQDNNDYMLYASYPLPDQIGKYKTTFSNIYNVKKIISPQASALPINQFWANYDLDLLNDIL
jgi:uncharacterized lipoprotein NlpE involved in copper resistance